MLQHLAHEPKTVVVIVAVQPVVDRFTKRGHAHVFQRSEDGLSITWNLRDDVMWSDGTPFTSADVVFTYDYCADEATGCASDTILEIASVVANDDYSVTVTFNDRSLTMRCEPSETGGPSIAVFN